VSRQSDPSIDHHRIRGVAVLPVVSVLERFAALGRQLNPDWDRVAIRDVRVLKGVRLMDFEGRGDRFTLGATPQGAGLKLSLMGEGGDLHYLGHLEPTQAQAAPWEPLPDLEPLPWPQQALYGTIMFHGPDFHVLSAVTGCSPEGIEGILRDARELNWPDGDQHIDQVLLDGGLQLAGLWGCYALGDRVASGQLAIPTQIGAYIQYERGLAPGPTTCRLRVTAAKGSRSVSDIQFVARDGRVWAEMLGVEMHCILDVKRTATDG
jgi:hypothetical protein